MPQHIVVEKFNPMWEKQFTAEQELIKSILKNNVAAIYHIGSTAVKGLCAKPIIDIMPVVYDLAEADFVATEFEKNGYEYLGEFGIKGRRYLRKGGDERTHHIHIFQKEDKRNIERHLAVRDYLRVHPDEAQRYCALKENLADRFPYDSESYCNGKENFMRRLEQTALSWYGNNIRPFAIGDIDAVMQLWLTENIRTHCFIASDYWKEHYNSVRAALPQAEIYVSVSHGEITGFIGSNGNYIEGIFVAAHHRHRGLGSSLLNRLKTEKSALTLNVYKKNIDAVKFYLKNGFVITNEKVDKGTHEKEYTMQWNYDDEARSEDRNTPHTK